jgi:hypothetical protein
LVPMVHCERMQQPKAGAQEAEWTLTVRRMIEQKKQVFQPYALTLADVVELMPFTVLVPTTLPWPDL